MKRSTLFSFSAALLSAMSEELPKETLLPPILRRQRILHSATTSAASASNLWNASERHDRPQRTFSRSQVSTGVGFGLITAACLETGTLVVCHETRIPESAQVASQCCAKRGKKSRTCRRRRNCLLCHDVAGRSALGLSLGWHSRRLPRGLSRCLVDVGWKRGCGCC